MDDHTLKAAEKETQDATLLNDRARDAGISEDLKKSEVVSRDVLERFGSVNHSFAFYAPLQAEIARSMRNLAISLLKQGDMANALAVAEELVTRFKAPEGETTVVAVAIGWEIRCKTLIALDRQDEALGYLNDFVELLGDNPLPFVRKVVIDGLALKCHLLQQREDYDGLLEAKLEMERRFGEGDTPYMRNLLAGAARDAGLLLMMMGNYREGMRQSQRQAWLSNEPGTGLLGASDLVLTLREERSVREALRACEPLNELTREEFNLNKTEETITLCLQCDSLYAALLSEDNRFTESLSICKTMEEMLNSSLGLSLDPEIRDVAIKAIQIVRNQAPTNLVGERVTPPLNPTGRLQKWLRLKR